MPKPAPCPCGSGHPLPACCGRFHAGQPAPDAEALMRSRYSAYVLGDVDYLMASWHPSTRPDRSQLEPGPGPTVRWLGLEVRSHRLLDADRAEVAFVARYRVGGGRAVRMCETSRFVRDGGRWLYVDGDVDRG